MDTPVTDAPVIELAFSVRAFVVFSMCRPRRAPTICARSITTRSLPTWV
jgi:hypothetical protein